MNKKPLKLIEDIRSLLVDMGDSLYYSLLSKELKTCNSVLDLGCGSCSPLAKIEGNFYSEGVDIYEESIKQSKKSKIHSNYNVADIRKIAEIYEENSFDAVIALDVIEHLHKKDALSLIRDMEKVAKQKVVLLTPNGFYEQGALKCNPYQIHYSGWNKSELEELGYKVYGLRGLKYLRGDQAEIKIKPWILGGVLTYISERIFFYFPALSFDLFAVKYV